MVRNSPVNWRLGIDFYDELILFFFWAGGGGEIYDYCVQPVW